MSKGPVIFADIAKKARDLLTAGYSSDQKFSVSTYSAPAGVALTSTAASKGGLSTGDVGAVYKYKSHVFDVKVDTLSNQSPAIDVSVTVGTPAITFGAEAGYNTSSGNFTKYTAGVSVTNRDAYASVILGDKGDTMTASYSHHLDESKRSAAVGEIMRRFSTNENTFTVGGSYAIDNMTLLKGKLNNHGKLAALLQHEVIPKSLMTISGEIDTKSLDKNPRFGVAIALKP
ncbi:Mitochondrial outer membrane protein porin 2 [Linum perenne]